MKGLILGLLIVISFGLSSQNPFEVLPKPKPVPEEIHYTFDETPLFPEGPEAMQKYLQERLSNPSVMRGVCSSRKLVVGFVVEKDGSLSHVEIIKGINGCPDFDYDVIRAVKSMPKWRPGLIKRHYVRCYYKMPVYVG